MPRFKCTDCGLIEHCDKDKLPTEHGYLKGNIFDGWKEVICKGTFTERINETEGRTCHFA